MGDRAVFGFRDRESDKVTVWLYSHWGGANQHLALANAITKAAPRWRDPSYATRIALSQLTREGWDGETGYGVYATADHGEAHGGDYDVNIVLWGEERVLFASVRDDSEVHGERTFDEYIAQAHDEALLFAETMGWSFEK